MDKSMSETKDPGTKDPSKQGDDPVPIDDTTRHRRICSSLVSVICYDPAVEPRKVDCVVTGIIIASGDNFCHILALWSRVLHYDKLSKWRFEVTFQDGTRMELPRQDVNCRGKFATFTLRPSRKYNPVKISEHQVSNNDQVFAVGFGRGSSPYGGQVQAVVSHRSRGSVTNAQVDWFCHDCSPNVETYHGDPVFNKKDEFDEFIGITLKDRGISVACSISYITKVLAKFHNGMVDKPLSEILQRITDKEEALKEKKQ